MQYTVTVMMNIQLHLHKHMSVLRSFAMLFNITDLESIFVVRETVDSFFNIYTELLLYYCCTVLV